MCMDDLPPLEQWASRRTDKPKAGGQGNRPRQRVLDVVHHVRASRKDVESAARNIAVQSLSMPVAHELVGISRENCGRRLESQIDPA
jgi:hypothetical protein